MQYSDSLIGTWPFCRVRLMDSSGSEHTRSALLLRHSLPQLLSSCQDRACLKAVGGAVARAGGHKKGPRTCGSSVLHGNQEKHPCASVYYRHLVSRLHTQHILLLHQA
jgi:hypothetical protein